MTHTILQNRISLQNIKVAEFASEETLCFVASVLLDGQPIAEARNDGHGGCTFLRPLTGTNARLVEAEAFAKSLPPVMTECDCPNDASHKLTINVTLDYLVDHIAAEVHAENRIRAAFNRDIANKTLFIKGNRLIYLKGLKLKTIKNRAALFAKLRAENGAEIILAELPQDEAFVLWKKYAVDGGQA